MWPNYPVTEQLETAFRLRQRMKYFQSCAHVLHKTLNFFVSRCCLAEYGVEIDILECDIARLKQIHRSWRRAFAPVLLKSYIIQEEKQKEITKAKEVWKSDLTS